MSMGHSVGISSNAGDLSPHRSTLETKEDNWTMEHGARDEFFLGESDTITISRQSLCCQHQQDISSCSSSSIAMPRFQDDVEPTVMLQNADIRFRCVSNDSISSPDFENNTEHNAFIAPMPRKVSLETVQAGAYLQEDRVSQASRQKRRRNPSLTEDAFHEGPAMDEDHGLCVDKPRKRRRLHERKGAMDSSDFALILGQLGM